MAAAPGGHSAKALVSAEAATLRFLMGLKDWPGNTRDCRQLRLADLSWKRVPPPLHFTWGAGLAATNPSSLGGSSLA